MGGLWTKWLARFEIYLTAATIPSKERKLALLLLFGGEHMQDIYETLDHTRETSEQRERNHLSKGKTSFNCPF